MTPTRDAAVEVLKLVYDPEIPVNIVDLGLVVDLLIHDDGAVRMTMNLTAPSCSMGPMIAADARARLLTLAGVTDASVEIVTEPVWEPARMSAVARKQLGIPEPAPAETRS